jgi:predicted Zn-dependent peptidase
MGLPVLLLALLVIAPAAMSQDLAGFEKRLTKFTLGNGLTFLVLERHEAPVVSFHTYADVGAVDEVKGITGVAHLFEHMAFHRKYYHPNNTMLAVWGDFETQQMIAKIKAAFQDWPKAGVELPPVPKVSYEFPATVRAVRKDDLNQSIIRLGHIGTTMSDPDYHALMVMNEILGGGFTSRLFKNVRSRQGLAYSVGGACGANYEYPGMFTLSCQTKLKSTVQATEAIVAEVQKMTQEEVTDEELALAKESYLNSFVFNFESKGQAVTRLMTYAYYGYPADFLQKIKANVEKVTKADVLRVAKSHLRPDKLQILIVGRPDDCDKPLSTLGEVKTLDITIPGSKK